jgi:hypothetical protein
MPKLLIMMHRQDAGPTGIQEQGQAEIRCAQHVRQPLPGEERPAACPGRILSESRNDDIH